jgi:hypothetical protein
LDAGGLTVLLILSRSSMYPGFDVVAMESEICHTLITTFSCDNGHVSPCMFLTAMATYCVEWSCHFHAGSSYGVSNSDNW